MSDISIFKIGLKQPICIPGFKEDDLRTFAENLEVELVDEDLKGLVFTNGGVQVKFLFNSDGNFSGVVATINGKTVPIIPGVGSNILQVFKGSPSATNPGPGWKVESDLTKKFLSQQDNEANWEIFYASRVGILNVFE